MIASSAVLWVSHKHGLLFCPELAEVRNVRLGWPLLRKFAGSRAA